MKKLSNQHGQCLWYLFNWSKFSLSDVIKDSMFYKFQSRLGEIERIYGVLAKRESESFVNRFGSKGTYFVYSAIDKSKISQILKDNEKLNEKN